MAGPMLRGRARISRVPVRADFPRGARICSLIAEAPGDLGAGKAAAAASASRDPTTEGLGYGAAFNHGPLVRSCTNSRRGVGSRGPLGKEYSAGMRRTTLATLVSALVVVGFAAFGILAAAASNPYGFTAVVNPLSHVPANGSLAAIDCAAPTSCATVGQDGNYQPLSLAGNPATWSAAQAREIPLAGSWGSLSARSLDSIACTSSSSCVAVGTDGNDEPLVLVGNPASWTVAEARSISLGSSFGNSGLLYSVDCSSSTHCVAVGQDGHGQTLVLAGNPATWGVAQAHEIALGTSFGSHGGLLSVTCTSATSCVGVGSDWNSQPLVLAGDPATWSVAQAQEITLGSSFGAFGDTGIASSLASVTCTSSTSCVAVGTDANGLPLVLVGNPATWSASQAQEINLGSSFGFPNYFGEALASVTCTSSTSCVAVGQDGNPEPFELAGNPATWGVAQAHEIAVGGDLSSIACTSTTSCVAVGQDENNAPLVLAGDPSTWGSGQAREITLTGHGFGARATAATLACQSSTSCLDVGTYTGGEQSGQSPYGEVDGTYLLRGSPASWKQAGTTLVTGVPSANYVDAVACPLSSYCVAVGYDQRNLPLVLAGNPSTWGTALPHEINLGSAFGSGGSLVSIACKSSTLCVAVGTDGKNQPLVLSGNPSTWSAANARQITLGTAFGSQGSLSSVSCLSTTYCVAVGASRAKPLVLVGNPSSWTAANARQIALGTTLGSSGWLASVSCLSTTSCVAVGASGTPTGNPFAFAAKPLVLIGNPATWSAASAFHLLGAASGPTTVEGFSFQAGKGRGFLTSVSCRSASYCVAVGGDSRAAPLYITGDPANWKGKLLARPARSGSSFTTAALTSTSCVSTACFAGGVASGGDFVATFN